MKTILDSKDEIKDKRALCFTAVSYGVPEEVSNFLKIIRESFKKHIDIDNICFFDTSNIEYKAHRKPEFFKKNSTLNFRIGKSAPLEFDKSYSGYFVSSDRYLDVHNAYFETEPNYEFIGKVLGEIENPTVVPYFKQQLLMDVLVEKFQKETIEPQMQMSTDIDLDFDVVWCKDGKQMAKVKYFINGYSLDYDLSAEIQKLKNIINCLDKDCADVFHSAYISFSGFDTSISHESFFNYQPDEIDRALYLNGCEWCTYCNNSLYNNYPEINFEDLSDTVNVEKTNHGIMYTAKTDIENFTRKERTIISKKLSCMLLPGYASVGWGNLFDDIDGFSENFDLVAVYYEPYVEYTIVIPHGMSLQQVEQDAFTLKDNCLKVLKMGKKTQGDV